VSVVPLTEVALRIEEGGDIRRVVLSEGTSVVGRARECDVVINDESVSRHHAEFMVTGGHVEIRDLGSRNGTMVNAAPVEDAVPVFDGDRLTFGDVTGTVMLIEAEPQVTGTLFQRPARLDPAASLASVADVRQMTSLLGEIARTLVGSMSLPEMLMKVLDLLFGHIRAERACVLMFSPGETSLAPVLARAANGRTTEQPEISTTVLDLAVRQGMAIVSLDARGDARFDSSLSLVRSKVRSIMCAPLYVADDVIGALYVDNAAVRQFSEADLELFTALANYSAVAIAQARLADRLAEERQRREQLQRYHSPAVVERILTEQAGDAGMSAQEIEVSILFVDIVDFTGLAESMRPAEVATLLNAFLSRMVDVIFEFEGTVDKFIGDAVLAVFGAPVEQPDHAMRAVRAAQAMRRSVREWNAARLFPAVRVRYAINSGVAIAGDLGSAKRKEYSVIGDVVNVAARLQHMAQPDQLVISRATLDQLTDPVNASRLGTFPVRGRSGSVEVLAIDP